MNSVDSIEAFLDDNFERFCINDITVREFARIYNKGIFLVTMRNHITTIIDGTIYDTFDPSSRIVWCAWIVEN